MDDPDTANSDTVLSHCVPPKYNTACCECVACRRSSPHRASPHRSPHQARISFDNLFKKYACSRPLPPGASLHQCAVIITSLHQCAVIIIRTPIILYLLICSAPTTLYDPETDVPPLHVVLCCAFSLVLLCVTHWHISGATFEQIAQNNATIDLVEVAHFMKDYAISPSFVPIEDIKVLMHSELNTDVSGIV